MEYFDDLAVETTSDQYEPAAIAHKNIQLMGVSCYCDEFSAKSRTKAPEEESLSSVNKNK